jgi:RNA exonuclease 4
MDTTNLSSNWKKLQAGVGASKIVEPPSSAQTSSLHGVKRKRAPSTRDASLSATKAVKKARPLSVLQNRKPKSHRQMSAQQRSEDGESQSLMKKDANTVKDEINAGLRAVEIGKYVAIDCEMVGVGPNPERESALARVSAVNFNGEQIYDSYVLPLEPITDYRTHVSGISAKHMKIARPFKEVQADVASIMKDRVVVGHSVHNDLEVLMASHPRHDIRDTARHPPFRKLAGGSWPRLQILASELLGIKIQEGEHSSIEDARACMLLFRKDKMAFDREHAKRWPARTVAEGTRVEEGVVQQKRKKKKKKRK